MADNNLGAQNLMQPIPSQTVVQTIIERITSAIAAGRFKLGEKLPSEFELMQELNVSRNSLREAMKILSATGIVNIKRGDGTYLAAQFNPNFFDNVIYSLIFESSTDQEIVELRQTLDEAVLKMAMKKIKQEEIEVLQKYNNKMKEYFNIGDIAKAAKLDYQFHLFLTDCCANVFLARIVKSVYQIFEKSIEKNIRTEELFAKAFENHQLVIDSLVKKDETMITPVVTQTLESWKKNVKKL